MDSKYFLVIAHLRVLSVTLKTKMELVFKLQLIAEFLRLEWDTFGTLKFQFINSFPVHYLLDGNNVYYLTPKPKWISKQNKITLIP